MGFPPVIDSFDSPADFGFYMPAEWSQHERCWMVWPHDGSYWMGRHDEVKKAYAAVAKAIRQFEPVSMLVSPSAYDEARELLGPAIELIELATDQAWLRDTGPNFLVNAVGELAGSSWQFNAWGDKYRHYANDALIGERILSTLGLANFTSPIYAEGGAVIVDGLGTVITTESCLLNKNRNIDFTKKEVEAELCRSLGAKKVIWLPGDKYEVETDGHVDGMLMYARPGVVLMGKPSNRNSPLYPCFQENYQALEGQTDAQGNPLQIVFIDIAEEADASGEKYCTSYVNSYLANGGVVMPRYGIHADERAKAVFAELFPERRIIQVDIDPIAIGGGGIHCITQQQPRLIIQS
ncbi:agmatine deiminase family protein [Maricurvus nonylphenolicus]|uniref:agmatine deiminase family protein n=1 Tax=Maricurvus nonylphenolicus TaxID=1008307 RepID=UPI0036F244AF